MTRLEQNGRCAEYGRAAIAVGTPDLGHNGDDLDGLLTDASDVIANIMHALYLHSDADSQSVMYALERAQRHWRAEVDDSEGGQ